MARAAQTKRPHTALLGISPASALAAVSVVVALVVALGPGAATPHAAIGAAPPKVIRLVSTPLTMRVLVDKEPLGASTGDTVYSANVLANAVGQFGLPKGSSVGSDTGRTTNLDAVPTTADIVARLPGGTLHVRGRGQVAGKTHVFPVVSGTGKFKGARGTLTVAPIAGSADSSDVYRLRYS